MCGIVGYIGNRSCKEIIFKGLQRLEYRGYDSAGIAVLNNDQSISFVKACGKLKELRPLLDQLSESSTIGIGHTRWATHGSPSIINAHPHVFGKLALIHNGIIENYDDLKMGLELAGTSFQTETDTEVALMMLDKELSDIESNSSYDKNMSQQEIIRQNIKQAIINLCSKLKGIYSFGVIYSLDPGALYIVKHGTPLVIGVGKNEMFFASDVAAFVEHSSSAVFLNDEEFARLTPDSIQLYNFLGEEISYSVSTVEIKSEELEKGGYAHYMLKEINEQPSVISGLVSRFIDKKTSTINMEELGVAKLDIKKIDNIHLIGCGTSFYSGYTSKYAIEDIVGIPVNLELSSEFRYRPSILNENSLVIAISQSGETADTLAGIKYAKTKGAQIFSICNVQYSSIPRESDACLYMDLGPEIGVASTKAFSSMVLCQYFVAIAMACIREGSEKVYSRIGFDSILKNMYYLPSLIEMILSDSRNIQEISNKYYNCLDFLYIGRGQHYSIALEGALKLKEISYIHAEGYAAGELKHGPIALVDSSLPIVALIPNDKYFLKTESNMEEVRARGGKVIGVGDKSKIERICADVLHCPQIDDPYLQSILSVIPLQLFAYYIANRRGADVDQPRNLAKSVTVE